MIEEKIVARYLMLALNGPTAGDGDEAEFNRWYDEIHIPDFLAIEQVRSAKRYKILRGNLPGMEAWPYLAAYEIETDDIAEVSRRFQTEMRPFHPTLDRSRSGHVMAIQLGDED
jgi:hypothetical protein